MMVRSLSLNHCLTTGPNLLEQILRFLLRSRRCKIEIISDIRKAFLQISVLLEDRDVLHFSWLRKLRKKQRYTRIKAMVFGVSIPFVWKELLNI